VPVPVPLEPDVVPPLVPVPEDPLVPVPLELPVPLEVPVPLEDPALLPPLVPVLGEELLPLVPVPLEDDPALFAPLPLLERSELVPLLVPELEPVFVRARSVSLVLEPLLLLLGRVVGSLLVVPLLGVREFVPVSLLSQPMNAIPPSANAAATKMP
jgi:hypothetical protein